MLGTGMLGSRIDHASNLMQASPQYSSLEGLTALGDFQNVYCWLESCSILVHVPRRPIALDVCMLRWVFADLDLSALCMKPV